MVVNWSISVTETQISTKRKFAADDVCPPEVERISVKSLTEDSHTGAEIIIRATQTPEA